MQEPPSPPPKPPRTWRPMAAWTAGILAGLSLVAFVAAILIPLRHTHRVLHDLDAGTDVPCDAPGGVTASISLLGGEARATRALNHYLVLPEWLSPYSGNKQQFNAYILLIHCGPSATPIINRALRSTDDAVRCDVIESFSWYPSAAGNSIPLLTAMLNDGCPGVRARAAEAIGRTGPEGASAVGALVRSLTDPDEWVRRESASALGNIGPTAGASAEALAGAIRSDDWNVAISASWALGKLGASANAAIPTAERMMKSPVVNDRRLAVRIWGRLGASAPGSIPALELALQDENPWVRSAAAEALSWWGRSAKPILPALLKALDDRATRYWATKALGNLGPDARPARPMLEELLMNADRDLAEAITEALKNIQGEAPPR